MQLPYFRYHPDPIATGAIKESTANCNCCGQSRGYVYTSSFYCPEKIDSLCPWCIADGSAADKFDGLFCDDSPLADLDEKIILEVSRRTPGFDSWQQEVWLTCCNDACEFHGDLPKEEEAQMSFDQFKLAFQDNRLTEAHFEDFKKHYSVGGSTAVYKWRCLHCGKIQYYADFS